MGKDINFFFYFQTFKTFLRPDEKILPEENPIHSADNADLHLAWCLDMKRFTNM